MPVKTLTHPETGQTLKFGRKRPVARGLRLSLKNYLLPDGLPPIPDACDYSAAASPVLADVFNNDTLGCCVVAGAYHIIGVETGNAGNLFHATDSEIIADYSAIGGYNGSEESDQGCSEPDALAYWGEHGFCDGTKLAGWLCLNPSNQQEIKAAIFLLENAYLGAELPQQWISPFPSKSGFTWDVAGDADPQNGHCIMGFGFNASGILVDSWGLTGLITWSAVAKYCSNSSGGSLYALLTPDQLANAQAKSPQGLNWDQMIADFKAVGGILPGQ